MQAAARVTLSALRAPSAVRACSSATAKAEYAAWLKKVSALPVVEAKFTSSLEFALPTPVPLHQFVQSPIVVEVQQRNPEFAHH